MEIFGAMGRGGHEQVVFWHEPEHGYRGIIAIHDTTLGPALGGTRFWDYPTDDQALVDVLRLSRGMTYKASLAGLDLGGGKSVIIGDHRVRERERIFRAHGRAVESLKGRYITAEDVGTSVEDMQWVNLETDHVTGLRGKFGDPSPATAFGVYRGLKACARHRYGDDSLAGRRVAVQGLGHVGYHLCKDLAGEGARMIVTDVDPRKTRRVVEDFGATEVAPGEIYGVEAEIFAPCALGAVVNDDTLGVFHFDIVAGAANNQLAGGRHGREIEERGILYAPDYVINAGGLINVYGELHGWSFERRRAKAEEIYDTLLQIFAQAKGEGIPASEAADRVAEHRLEEARGLSAATR